MFRKPTRPSLPLKKESFESLRLPLAKGSSTSNQAFLLRRKDVTALRCSEPLRPKVGGKHPTPMTIQLHPQCLLGIQGILRNWTFLIFKQV